MQIVSSHKGHDVKQMSNLQATIPSNNFRCSQVLEPLSHRKIRKVTNLCNASFMCILLEIQYCFLVLNVFPYCIPVLYNGLIK